MRSIMETKIGKKPLPLDTLGQLPTDGLKTLKKRARSKWWTQAIVGRLLYLESPLHKYYQSAYFCSHILTQTGQKVTAKYCDSRICHVCNRIRTAKMMNGYVTQLQKLGALQFVTLTIPNCNGDDLNDSVSSIIKSFSNIVRVIRERKKIAFSGIRKLEITFNPRTGTFHPHVHALVDSDVGDLIVDEWLKRYPDAVRIAQDVTDADKDSLNELFKYTTKIVAGRNKNVFDVFIPAIDRIMIALRGRRSFQPFGNIKKVDEEIGDLDAVDYDIPEYDFIEWVWKECDWVNNRKTLTGYVPPDIEFNFYE
jgi:hypothetical protein